MKFIRAFSAVLAFTFVLCFIGGCGIYTDTPEKASEIFAEIKTDSDLVYNSKGSFSVNLTSEQALFADNLTNDDITVYCGRLIMDVLPEIDAAEPITLEKDELGIYKVPVSSLERTGDKSVTVSFTDNNFAKVRPDSYIFLFNKTACKQNLYMTGAVQIKYPTFSMVSDTTTVLDGQRELKVNLTLDKGSFNPDITESDITLSGGFSSCEVSSARISGDNTLNVILSCPDSFTGDTGYITVTGSAVTDSSFDVTAAIRIAYPKVIFDAAAFEASDNYARISIVLSDCSFLDSAGVKSISCNDENIEINRIDYTSQNEAIIYLSFDMENVNDAIKAISDAGFVIDSSAINIKKDLSFIVKPQSPKIIPVITSVSERESDFVVNARLGMLGGTFNVLNKNSFVFGGDYSKAVVEAVTSKDNSAQLTFVIPRTASAETAVLNGTIAIKKGNVTGRWGQTDAISSFPLCYNAYSAKVNIDNSDWNINDVINACKDAEAFVERNNIKEDGNVDLSELSSAYYQNILLNNSSGTAFMNQLLDVISDERIPSTAEARYYQNKLLTFLTDINTLSNNDYEAINALTSLIDIDARLKQTNDSQKIENLLSDAQKQSLIITNSSSARFSGKSRAEINSQLISICTSADNAATAFDNLVGRLYNWSAQSDRLSELFRYYSYSTILNSMVISVYSMNKLPVTPDTYSSYNEQLSELRDFAEHTDRECSVFNEDIVYCNTLNRSIKLSRFNGGLNQMILSSSAIFALENNLPEDITLKQELATKANAEIAAARYLICSDSQISESFTYNSVDGDNFGNNPAKLFGFSKKTTLYNLLTGVFENELEYLSYYFKLEIEGETEKPIITVHVKKNTDLYILT